MERTLNDVIIKSAYPQSKSQVRVYSSAVVEEKTDPRDVKQLQQENDYLKILIQQLKNNQSQPKQEVLDQGGLPNEFNKRIQTNEATINQLKHIIQQQNEVIQTYDHKFKEFENNLQNIMKLDKDIHAKLNSGQNTSILEKNVKNTLIALNSKAPYDKLIEMIQNIKL